MVTSGPVEADLGRADIQAMAETKSRRKNEARRLKIASGLVEGKSMAEIAREEGVSRQTIWKQAGSADVGQILVSAVNSETERINGTFLRLLAAIDEALVVRVVRVGKDGEPI